MEAKIRDDYFIIHYLQFKKNIKKVLLHFVRNRITAREARVKNRFTVRDEDLMKAY